ncbi:HesB family member [Plasmodium coatneyi]|uniref:HesB family member n=1 Tax=Plasmodium coatneyi TaxID=208452 RepID=A0A1B1DYN2_9APIC|nr:HesB family member [Plasmodium coatneyi]ANQ07878.1 HesB family member [Plasmodium coatneyi]
MMFCGPCRCAYHLGKTNIPSKGVYGAHVKGEVVPNRLDHLVVRISRNKRSDPFEESFGGRQSPRPADSKAELGAKISTNRGAHFMASFGPNGESEKRGKEYLLNELNEFVSLDRRGEESGGTVKSSTQSEKNSNAGGHDEEVKLERLLKKRQGKKKDIVTITEKAKDEIKKLIKEYHSKEDKDTKNYVLKLFYIIKGCNGLTHSFNFVHRSELHANDELIFEDDCREKILLAIDSKCVLYVINTTLDYYRDDLTERFIFTNPNVTSVCPCGTSFHFNPGGSSS